LSTCASTLDKLAAWSPGTTVGGRTLGRNAKAGNGEITFDRRVAGAIEAFEFLRRHLRTDKVILVAESMGTLTAGSPGAAPARPSGGSGAWNANMAWAFRATCLRRTWTAGRPSRAWRCLTAATRWIGWWVLSLLAELAEGLLLRCLESSELYRKRLSVVLDHVSDAFGPPVRHGV
jgi:hypothetical protein